MVQITQLTLSEPDHPAPILSVDYRPLPERLTADGCHVGGTMRRPRGHVSRFSLPESLPTGLDYLNFGWNGLQQHDIR